MSCKTELISGYSADYCKDMFSVQCSGWSNPKLILNYMVRETRIKSGQDMVYQQNVQSQERSVWKMSIKIIQKLSYYLLYSLSQNMYFISKIWFQQVKPGFRILGIIWKDNFIFLRHIIATTPPPTLPHPTLHLLV